MFLYFLNIIFNKKYFQNCLIYLLNLAFIIIVLEFNYLIFLFNSKKFKILNKISLCLGKYII